MLPAARIDAVPGCTCERHGAGPQVLLAIQHHLVARLDAFDGGQFAKG